jgi:hypothetical protein
MQACSDQYGGTRLVANAAFQHGQTISTVPLHQCLCILHGRRGPQQLREALHVDVSRLHQQWQADAGMQWPKQLLQHLRDATIPGDDRLVTWLSWIQLHANADSKWQRWTASLPRTGDVQLARHTSTEVLELVSSQQLYAICKAELRAHDARWQRFVGRYTDVWPDLGLLRPDMKQEVCLCEHDGALRYGASVTRLHSCFTHIVFSVGSTRRCILHMRVAVSNAAHSGRSKAGYACA